MSDAPAFDGAPRRGDIDFGVGQPSADLLPLELLRAASERFYAGAQRFDLNYGERQGAPRFLAALAGFLSEEEGAAVDPATLSLSGGISQALDFLVSRFTRPGDCVLVEDPCYALVLPILRDHGLRIVGVPLDGQGMDMQRLEQLLVEHKPRLLYTVPSFQNPTGQCLPRERRERLLALAREHDVVILADEVYQQLHYGAAPPPSLGSLAGDARVYSLGSFSKILAPALRLGWIRTGAAATHELMQSGVLISGGSFNRLASFVTAQIIEEGGLAANIALLREAYAARIEALDAALVRHFDGIARWSRPAGGYFLWLELPAHVDMGALETAARAEATGFLPGTFCSNSGAMRHCLRLSFAHYAAVDLREGVARLRRAYDRVAGRESAAPARQQG